MIARTDMLAREGRICTRAAELLATSAAAEVHSVFATSMNVLADGALVHVGPASRPLSCTGVAIDDWALAAFLPAVQRGDAVSVLGGELWVHGSGARLGVDVASLVPVDLSVRSLRAGADDLEALGAVLRRHAAVRPCGISGDKNLDQAARLLALPEPGTGELARAASLLVGRGPGLTPSGDDVLVGYGLGLWLMGDQAPYLDVLLAMGGTTDVSLEQLRAVAEGHVSEPLHALATALAGRAAPGLVERAVGEVEAIGHTSGADALCGLGIACERARAKRAAERLSMVGR